MSAAEIPILTAEIPIVEPLRPWSPRARALVGRLPIGDLAALLVGEGVRLSGSDLYCRACQRNPWDQAASAGMAVVDAASQRWRCTRCRARGDRWGLERAVLGDAVALELLADLERNGAS